MRLRKIRLFGPHVQPHNPLSQQGKATNCAGPFLNAGGPFPSHSGREFVRARDVPNWSVVMTRRTRYAIAGGLLSIATTSGVAIVHQRSSAADARRALTLASDSTALELALQAGSRTQFVSALERNEAEPAPAPAPKAGRSTVTRRPTRAAPVEQPTRARISEPQATEIASVPEEVAAPTVETAPAPSETPAEAAPAPAPSPDRYPSPAPQPGRGRRGGWWTTGDVIRNAPFPINP